MKKVQLASIIKSLEVGDSTTIKVYGADGRFITKGNWFHDTVLYYADMFGHATFHGGSVVSFKLAH